MKRLLLIFFQITYYLFFNIEHVQGKQLEFETEIQKNITCTLFHYFGIVKLLGFEENSYKREKDINIDLVNFFSSQFAHKSKYGLLQDMYMCHLFTVQPFS